MVLRAHAARDDRFDDPGPQDTEGAVGLPVG
jgi:hypothetical protein